MARQNITDRECIDIEGVLHPDAIYTTKGALKYGALGEDELSKGRKAGVIRPIRKGNYLRYEGSELIEWIRTSGRKE